ncbi:11531_t:CDS:2 [Acaulospora morrowiae]|uniref:DNA-directed RNA polymerases I and III subunit RPAC2 n=1 Tax=Acaulospora morrowiae TaxID=94023 RepID=A0A9N9N4E1_9GLOM|nr:11531_t:CDS:2 [Acaulospora morrowiae]
MSERDSLQSFLFTFPHPPSQKTEETGRPHLKLANDIIKDNHDNNRAPEIDPTILANNSPRNSFVSTSRASMVTAKNSHLTDNGDNDDIWDDTAFIVRIMNLADTIGSEPVVDPKVRTSDSTNDKQTVRKVYEHQKTDSGFAQIPEECHVTETQIPETPAQEYARIMRHPLNSPSSQSTVNQVNEMCPSSAEEDTEKSESDSINQTLRHRKSNLSRRSSIHFRKSMDGDDRSILSKKSKFSQVEEIIEVPEEEADIGDNGRNLSPGKKKRASTNNLKNKDGVDADNQLKRNDASSNNSTSSNNDNNSPEKSDNLTEEKGVTLVKKRYNHGIKGRTSDVREFGNDCNYYTSANSEAESSRTSRTTGECDDGTGHSNFYLAMPNGQWMVRTRTASRKIVVMSTGGEPLDGSSVPMETDNMNSSDIGEPTDQDLLTAPEVMVDDILDFKAEKGVVKDPTSVTFTINGEDHTLGNALRYTIMLNPEVEYCGYSIPHPSEDKLNIRVQTTENTTAIEALRKGLEDLKTICDHIKETFIEANLNFDNRMISSSSGGG